MSKDLFAKGRAARRAPTRALVLTCVALAALAVPREGFPHRPGRPGPAPSRASVVMPRASPHLNRLSPIAYGTRREDAAPEGKVTALDALAGISVARSDTSLALMGSAVLIGESGDFALTARHVAAAGTLGARLSGEGPLARTGFVTVPSGEGDAHSAFDVVSLTVPDAGIDLALLALGDDVPVEAGQRRGLRLLHPARRGELVAGTQLIGAGLGADSLALGAARDTDLQGLGEAKFGALELQPCDEVLCDRAALLAVASPSGTPSDFPCVYDSGGPITVTLADGSSALIGILVRAQAEGAPDCASANLILDLTRPDILEWLQSASGLSTAEFEAVFLSDPANGLMRHGGKTVP